MKRGESTNGVVKVHAGGNGMKTDTGGDKKQEESGHNSNDTVSSEAGGEESQKPGESSMLAADAAGGGNGRESVARKNGNSGSRNGKSGYAGGKTAQVKERHSPNGANGSANGQARLNGSAAAANGTGRRLAQRPIKEYASKRFLDLFLGSFAMVIFLLMTPFIALGIKISSRGPVFFRQKRTGKNGITFTCYKFRTMRIGSIKHDYELGTPDITIRGDDRIFTFGRFLRFLNLDELPQIINVFRGDMSLVGPRPYPVDECAYWNSTFDDFYIRYSVKPGITGFAQVKGFRGGTLDLELMRKRTDYDLIYVQKNSLLFDIKTIGLTVTQMVNLETNGY